MKLIVSTFLVYKVKKHLLKSGKVSSSDGPFMPFGWSFCARYTGIRSPPSGHLQPLCWATTAHKAGNECPNIGLIFGQYSFDSLRYLACPRRPRRVCHGLMTHPIFIFQERKPARRPAIFIFSRMRARQASRHFYFFKNASLPGVPPFLFFQERKPARRPAGFEIRR